VTTRVFKSLRGLAPLPQGLGRMSPDELEPPLGERLDALALLLAPNCSTS
jgi:hypothetical protein